MTIYSGYYSLIQYCPEPARAEMMNVGVLLFCPELPFISAVISPDNQRIKAFLGERTVDDERLQMVKQGIVDRIRLEKDRFRTLDDLNAFVNTRANNIRLTQPQFVKVAEPQEVLKSLYGELVGDTPESAIHSAAENVEVYR